MWPVVRARAKCEQIECVRAVATDATAAATAAECIVSALLLRRDAIAYRIRTHTHTHTRTYTHTQNPVIDDGTDAYARARTLPETSPLRDFARSTESVSAEQPS